MPEFRFEVVAANAPKLVEAFYDRIWNRAISRPAEQLLTGNFAFRRSLGAERVRHNADGLGIQTEALDGLQECDIDTRVVPGAFDMAAVRRDRPAQARSSWARRGCWMGRRAVTHWMYCDLLSSTFPATRVETDAIFVRDGQPL
jgi:transcriptional regulator GlxA family with amidase domain